MLTASAPGAERQGSQARLPAFLRPRRSAFLVRLGRDHDGGYLVDRRDVEAADGLIGLGLNDDWSFEKAFAALNDVPIVAYDGSVGRQVFRRRIAKALPRLDRPMLAVQGLRTLRDYESFFQGRRRHVEAFVGLDRPPRFVGLGAVFAASEAAGVRRPFLKIDIEGSEYRILDELAERAAGIAGLAIELHDCDLHLPRIERFVERSGLALVHLHPNNFAPLTGGGLPLVLEATFTSSPVEGVADLPHPLDMPCDPTERDHALVFDG